MGPQDRAARVLEDLRILARESAERAGLTRGERSPVEALVVPLVVSLDRDGVSRGSLREADRLVRDIAARVDEALRGAGAFHPGRVHCFQCDASDCPHGVPGSPTETFAGWVATGKPEWIDFANLLLERGDPRVDRLYAPSPEVVAIAMRGRDLHGRLLGAIGRDRSFAVLGQVAAGLIPGDFGAGRGPEARVALTLQVIETRFAGGGRRLRLNLLGTTLDEVSAASEGGGGRGSAERLRRLIILARERLDLLGRAAAVAERRGRPLDLEAQAEPLLLHLRTELERVFRDAGHRTRHAVERHLDGGRPTDTALVDARRAPVERLRYDEQRKTVVVLGPRGRAHVFSPDGRHVTSLSLGPAEAERKGGQHRWRPLTGPEADDFRKAIAEHPCAKGRPIPS
jgi:hypothetical protein